MPLFVVFVFASVVFGAGLLFSPALPTRQPRIALAGALALAGVLVLAVGYTALFRWDTLIVDYLWFGLIVGVFLTGTFSLGMFKAENEGRKETGWPGPRELAFFGVVALLFIAPTLIFPVPLDTDAQGFGYLGLVLREGGSLTTLAPFHPEISYLYSPAFPVLVAYLAHALNAGIQNIQLALGAVLAFLFVALAYDFGNEVEEDLTRRTGLFYAGAALIGTGLLLATLDSHYTTLLALVFALGFLCFTMRVLRGGGWKAAVPAAVLLAGVPLSHPDTTIILILGFAPWLLTLWIAKPRPTFRRWLLAGFGVPLLALLLIAPWLVKIAPLLGSSIASPFEIDPRHLFVLVAYHGVVIIPFVLWGTVIALRRRSLVDVLMLGWLLLVVDFSSIGILPRLLSGLLAPLLKYDYPFSIAWHGPIIPYTVLGAMGLLAAARRIGPRFDPFVKRISLPALAAAALVIVLVVALNRPLLAASKATPLMIFGAFASAADVRAMEWLKANAPADALILNHPGPQEGDWVPLIAQRDTVYFRPQPFYRGTERSDARQTALLAFWQNPADTANAELLRQYKISYVIVPQIAAQPDALAGMFRWRAPVPTALLNIRADLAPYLKLAFESDGAQVYQVMP